MNSSEWCTYVDQAEFYVFVEVSACDLLEELPTEEIPDDLFFGQF